MPSVFVVPVDVEVPDGFERAVATLESCLGRAGYAFYVGEASPLTLDEFRKASADDFRSQKTMAKSVQDDLLECLARNICPNCRKEIQEDKRYPYGKGVFCSLDCVAKHNAAQLIEKHKKRVTTAHRHRDS